MALSRKKSSLGKFALIKALVPVKARSPKILTRILPGASADEDRVRQQETETEKLIYATEQSQDVLKSATTVVPFVLFPDTISIDRQKITIIHRSAFRTSRTVSVHITDIQNIEADIGPLFGSVSLTSHYFANNIQRINFLRRKDAMEIHELIQGGIIAHRMKIDTAGIDNHQLKILLKDLGQSSMK